MMWQLRPPTADDVSFLFNSWLKSFRDAPAMANMTHTVYYREMHKCIEGVFRSPNARVVVACEPNNEDVIFGYGIGELVDDVLVIHFLYSKHPFRNFGLGKAMESELLKNPHKTVEFSCWSKMTKVILKQREYVYNPFRLTNRSN